jgi:hypothetical protein
MSPEMVASPMMDPEIFFGWLEALSTMKMLLPHLMLITIIG